MKLKGIAATFVSIFTAIILVVSSGAVNIPDPSPEFYVYDDAGVISTSVRDTVISQNRLLAYATGSEIVVATVKSTEGESISTFAGEMFAKWGIGDSSKKNGVLMLLVIEDDNYWVVQGSGISGALSSAKIKSLIDTYLEPSFAAKDYSTGVSALFSKMLAEVAAIYDVDLSEITLPEVSEPQAKGGLHPIAVIGIILAVAAVLAAAVLAARYFLLPGQYRSSRRPKISLTPGSRYSGAATARPNVPAGVRPNAPTSPRPNAPAGVRPNVPAGARPNVPAGVRPNLSTSPRPNAPAGARPNTPAGARPNAPAGARPSAPAGARPNAPAGARPSAPAGARPSAPAGARPNVPAGARPGGTYPGNPNRPRQ